MNNLQHSTSPKIVNRGNVVSERILLLSYSSVSDFSHKSRLMIVDLDPSQKPQIQKAFPE